MALLERDEVKSVVSDSLHEVADFNSDCELFDFSKFHDYHKYVLIREIASGLAAQGISVSLSITQVGTMKSVGALINYVTKRQVRQSLPESKLTLP